MIAAGAQKPRVIPIPGKEKLVPALEFLRLSKTGEVKVGKRVVIIGAGNVGCDAATEAYRLGAEEVTLVDIQEPLSFGKERRDAEAAGAKFRWPCFSKAVTDEGLELTTGEVIPADTVIISVGDMPDLDFLPETVETERGFIKVNEFYQTTDPKIFAVGDAVKLGLLTDAIGAGRKAASAIASILSGNAPASLVRQKDRLLARQARILRSAPAVLRRDRRSALPSAPRAGAAATAAYASPCARRRPSQRRTATAAPSRWSWTPISASAAASAPAYAPAASGTWSKTTRSSDDCSTHMRFIDLGAQQARIREQIEGG